MISIPKMNLKFIDAAKTYNALHIADITSVDYPTNYYLLSPEQRTFVEALIAACEQSFQDKIDDYNEEITYLEEEIKEYIRG